MTEPNWKNRTLFHGDNLKFLRSLNSESIDLIATDPPFNKGKDFHATPGSLAKGAKFQDRWSWENDVHEEWIDQIKDDYPRLMEAIESARYAHSDGMGAYMCFMAVRLLAMRRVLKPTGSIYLHCDPTASHYLKAIMDAIFGWKNFRNEIVWHYRTGGSSKRNFAKKHDIILLYSKSDHYIFNHMKERSYTKSKSRKPGLVVYGVGRETVFKEDNKGVYADVTMRDVWDISYINSQAKERTGYPTQKPLKLYERIIKASSNEGDIVLDPFAGCATTCVAAERLNRQWIGIDIWEKAHEVVVKRIEKEVGLLGDVIYTNELPERTDDGETASPYLRVKEKVKEPPSPYKSRADMLEFLLEQDGSKCRGCDREFDDPRYLELDHNWPRAEGGLNHITNRILLCGPCNKTKRHKFTLSQLREINEKNGWMAK